DAAAARLRALQERRQDTDHRILRPAEEVAELHRRHAAVARDEARQRDVADVVPRPVAPGTVLAESGDAADHQAPGVRQQIREAESLEDAGAEALDEYVGGAAQAPQLRGAGWSLQIEDDRSLPAVQRREHSGGNLAQVIARVGVFHLHYVGAQIGQHERRIWPREEPGQIEHADALERLSQAPSAISWRCPCRP